MEEMKLDYDKHGGRLNREKAQKKWTFRCPNHQYMLSRGFEYEYIQEIKTWILNNG